MMGKSYFLKEKDEIIKDRRRAYLVVFRD